MSYEAFPYLRCGLLILVQMGALFANSDIVLLCWNHRSKLNFNCHGVHELWNHRTGQSPYRLSDNLRLSIARNERFLSVVFAV